VNTKEIEKRASNLQRELWARRSEFWPDRAAPSYFDVLDPELAAFHLGVNFALCETLGRFGSPEDQFEVAGSIDRYRNQISISRKFRPDIMRFTAAHEIGHWLLHPGAEQHRDRPINGLDASSKRKRGTTEREADYFATCFLMPERLVRRTFVRLFGKDLTFDEAAAFELSPSDFGAFLRPQQNTLSRELIMANAQRFNGLRFRSMAEQFGVSPTTMAIRLRELNLTPWP
jgi:hypothetical protein